MKRFNLLYYCTISLSLTYTALSEAHGESCFRKILVASVNDHKFSHSKGFPYVRYTLLRAGLIQRRMAPTVLGILADIYAIPVLLVGLTVSGQRQVQRPLERPLQ